MPEGEVCKTSLSSGSLDIQHTFFPYQNWATCVEPQACWCDCTLPCLALSTQHFSKQVPTCLRGLSDIAYLTLTNPYTWTNSFINVQKQLFSSHLTVDFTQVWPEITYIKFLIVFLQKFRNKSYFPLKFNLYFSFFCFGLVELLFAQSLC